MKKIFIITILLIAFLTNVVQAQPSDERPGILPDSPFYFVKVVKEKIVGVFKFSEEAKTIYQIELAEKRLKEAKALADKGKSDLAIATLERYYDNVQKVSQELVGTEIATNQGRIIEEIKFKVPQENTQLLQETEELEMKVKEILKLQKTILSLLPVMVLDSPNGGEQWPIGATRYIRWYFPGKPKYPIIQIEGYLYKGGRSVIGLFALTGDKIYGPYEWKIEDWQVPETGNDYKIKVSAIGQGDVALGEDVSDARFSIIQPLTGEGRRLFKAEKYGFEMLYPADWVVSGPFMTGGPYTSPPTYEPDSTWWVWENPGGALKLRFSVSYPLNGFDYQRLVRTTYGAEVAETAVDKRKSSMFSHGQTLLTEFEIWICKSQEENYPCLVIGIGAKGVDREFTPLLREILDSIKIGPEFDALPPRAPGRG